MRLHPDVPHTTPGSPPTNFLIFLMNFLLLFIILRMQLFIYDQHNLSFEMSQVLRFLPAVLRWLFNSWQFLSGLCVSFCIFLLPGLPRVAFQAHILCSTLVFPLIKIMPPLLLKLRQQASQKIRKQQYLEIQTEQSTLNRCCRHLNTHTFLQLLNLCVLMYNHAEVHLRVCVQKTKRVYILYNPKIKNT